MELKAKAKELERVKKELQAKAAEVGNLRKAVDALNERMMSYEVKSSNVSEEQKMSRLQDDLKSKEHQNELKKLKDKLAMITASRDEKAKEL